MEDIYNYNKRETIEVKIGNVIIGGEYPVVIQSMANVKTADTEAAVKQAIRIFGNGGKIVRFTTPSMADAKNMANIKSGISEEGFDIPLVADVHFSPDIADAVSSIVDKVRINPGNYVRSIRKDKTKSYTDKEFKDEYEQLKERFINFISLCKENNTAIRIGVNHGSLSERIMDRYGDTPEGIVESGMEMMRICRDEGFNNVVVSVKSSNTSMMVKTVRLLADSMNSEEILFPIHLGVTEAGEGEDGRIKSAVGIGTLLSEGIGDTIRVSLSEEPEEEPPVARQIVNYVCRKINHDQIFGPFTSLYDKYDNQRRKTTTVRNIGGNNVPVVITDISKTDISEILKENFKADYIYAGMKNISSDQEIPLIVDAENKMTGENIFRIYDINQLNILREDKAELRFLKLSLKDINTDDNFKQVADCERAIRIIELLKSTPEIIIVADSDNLNIAAYQRAFAVTLQNEGIKNSLITYINYKKDDIPTAIKLSVDAGPVLIDKMTDGLWIEAENESPEETERLMFSVLQATGARITKTEYISCPGCGRTMFDLQKTISRVKEATSHLTGLKIGIMGCIVNGPGEMADADYGYVGAGKDKISLYKGRECVEKNISEEKAVEKLIEIMKANGDWKEKENL